MSYALIEVEATARKAARGAGYSWGISEEASKATRFLCAFGLDGCGALVLVLNAADKTSPAKLAPVDLIGDWHSKSGNMCPLMAGASLSDTADRWARNGLQITNVTAPILLLPFAANAALALADVVTVAWNGVKAVTNGSEVCLEIADNSLLLSPVQQVSLQTGGKLEHLHAKQSRAYPIDADWSTLNDFAQRTYAPDTEESRLKGAGAGLTDND